MLMIDDLMKELALVKEENKALRDSMASWFSAYLYHNYVYIYVIIQ